MTPGDLIPHIFEIAFIAAVLFSLVIFFINKNKLEKANSVIAKNLGWNYVNFAYDEHFKQYVYFRLNNNFGIYKNFTGVYEGVKFALIESKYLMVEFENLSHKFYGIEIFSKSMMEFKFKNLYSKFRSLEMDSNEFNKIFNTYQLEAGDAYYDLPPNAMATIIDLSKNFDALAIEAKKDNILIYGIYLPYYQLKQSARVIRDKQEVLLKFLSITKQIQKVLV